MKKLSIFAVLSLQAIDYSTDSWSQIDFFMRFNNFAIFSPVITALKEFSA
jgi:hypothetical protein